MNAPQNNCKFQTTKYIVMSNIPQWIYLKEKVRKFGERVFDGGKLDFEPNFQVDCRGRQIQANNDDDE